MSEIGNGSMKVLGLTGGIACGKSSGANFLAGLGAKVIDADKISRLITAPGGAALPAIREAFGEGVFEDENHLDRKALGNLVFADDAARRTLEKITHPLIQQATLNMISEYAQNKMTNVVLDVPLLYETGMDVLCDEVWLFALPPEEQLERVMERDGLTAEQAKQRIDSQYPLERKLQLADRVIWTNRSIQQTQHELEGLWAAWVKRVGKGNR